MIGTNNTVVYNYAQSKKFVFLKYQRSVKVNLQSFVSLRVLHFDILITFFVLPLLFFLFFPTTQCYYIIFYNCDIVYSI